ncbi:DENN domain-containing protein 3-like isoform X2 [Dysidea avara]|uniref:DENN domain-containing protein 3-like isoform X2 n=1 Tax=Dysidea avara TaxID=196820 RepID=UPI003332DFC7
MSTVLTDIDGRRTYCTGLRFYQPFTVKEHENQTFALNACSRKDSPPSTKLVYVPSCAVFQSSVPCYNLQKELLSCLLHNLAQKDDLKFWDVLQKFVKKLFWIPVPPPGRLCTEFSVGDYCGSICPPLSEYVNLDIRLNYPFPSLSIDSVLEVVGALLMEQRIVFVSTSYTLLTYNMECFFRFISPFEWRSTYVLVLPSEMMGLLDAPGSFLYGCHSDCIDEEILSTVEELVIVNLDNDEVQQLNYESNLPKMPQSVCDNFKQSYKKLKVWYELEESDRPMPLPAASLVQHRHEFERHYDSYLLDIFLNMMVELFGEVTYYLCSGNLKLIRYEESPTYQSACKETKEFYKLALSTDLFSLLLQNRNTKTTRDSFTLISDKKRRGKRMLEMCDTTITDTTAAATTGRPIKQRSEEQDTPKAPSSLSRLYSQQPLNSPKESPDTLHTTKRTSSLKQPIPLLPEQPKRLLPHSTSGSDLETAADSLAALCSCDPSTYCRVKLPLLRDEVSPEEVFADLIAQLTEVIKESATTKGKMAPALYLRACVYIATGQHDKGFYDFATLDKHSVQLMPNQRTLESIMAPLPKDVIAGLKGQPFWPLFTRRLREYSRQSSYRVTDLRHKLPTKPLRNELFLRTMQKNNIVSDGDSAGRLYELLTDNKPAVSVEDLESFYESWRSVTDDNQSTDLHTELLQMEIMGFKHSEKVLATVTSSQLKTSFGSGHVILTTCRLLLRNSLKISTICDLTSNVKVERHEDINVLGVGQPMITFGTEAGTSSTSSIKSQASSITKSQAISSTRHHLSAPRFPRATMQAY